MTAMKCELLTPRVQRWLTETHKARILNRFDQVCNLVNDEGAAQGAVVSLVSTNIGPGPFSMVLDGVFTPGEINAETAVSVDPFTRSLNIGTLRIDTDRADLWNPIPDWQKMKAAAQPFLAYSLPPAGELVDDLARLVQGITNRNRKVCQGAAGRLAGLGSGLTPAGDDMLMGTLYAMWAWYPDRDLMRLIVDTAVPRTTTLSAAFLRAAGDGEATIHWHDLADGRTGALDRILAIGATSGRDAWIGFTTAAVQFCGLNPFSQ